MTCREMSQFLLEYTSGELDAELRTDFEQHIADCPNCHEFLRQYRTTILAGQAAFKKADAAFPDAMPEDLIQAIVESLKKSP